MPPPQWRKKAAESLLRKHKDPQIPENHATLTSCVYVYVCVYARRGDAMNTEEEWQDTRRRGKGRWRGGGLRGVEMADDAQLKMRRHRPITT